MKRNVFSILFFIAATIKSARAQDTDIVFGKLVLAPHVQEKEKLPAESTAALTRKLEQIISKSGAVARDRGTVYVLSAEIGIVTKDMVAGPPQIIAQNLELILRVGDASSGIVFSTASIALRGVGANENKSTLDAIKTISPGNKEIQESVEKGKEAIVEYYKINCSKLIDDATSKAQMGQHDEAIYLLSRIPDANADCYSRALEVCQMVYQAKINSQGAEALQAAKSAWSTEPNYEGAQKAASYIRQISPYSSSWDSADKLIKSILKKLETQLEAGWNQQLNEYEDSMAMQRESMRIAEENAKGSQTSLEEQLKRQHELDSLLIREFSIVAQAYSHKQPKSIENIYIRWK